jgi:hypothetical protein
MRLLMSGASVLLLGTDSWVRKNLARHVVGRLPKDKNVAIHTTLSTFTRPDDLRILLAENLHRRRADVLRPHLSQCTVVRGLPSHWSNVKYLLHVFRPVSHT